MSDPYQTLRVRHDDGVARVTIDHPPLNLFDATLKLSLRMRFGLRPGGGRRCEDRSC